VTFRFRDRPSPNHGPRIGVTEIDMLILHYTGMVSAEAALDRLCTAEAEVSAHYLIEEDGLIHRLVDEDCRAWHAGRSFWAGRRDINSASIGIELVNPGHEFGYRPFPEPQMVALIALCQDIQSRHPIRPAFVLGHSDVAPQRKCDPGELFDWPRLSRAGIGRFPDFENRHTAPSATEETVSENLRQIGYEIFEDDLKSSIAAFQRHYRPGLCDGIADAETCHRIARLAAEPI